MCIGLIGGMDRLEKNYIREAGKFGIDLKVFTRYQGKMAAKLQNMDALIIFTNKISHNAKKEATETAKANDIPIYFYHSCGVCTLRNCLNCMQEEVVELKQ